MVALAVTVVVLADGAIVLVAVVIMVVLSQKGVQWKNVFFFH